MVKIVRYQTAIYQSIVIFNLNGLHDFQLSRLLVTEVNLTDYTAATGIFGPVFHSV